MNENITNRILLNNNSAVEQHKSSERYLAIIHILQDGKTMNQIHSELILYELLCNLGEPVTLCCELISAGGEQPVPVDSVPLKTASQQSSKSL